MSSRRGSTLVAAGILLSRLSGLVRERVIAHFLGTSFANDAYRAAVRIPNLLQNLLGEGVLSASFIPVYARLLADGRDEEAGRVAGAIAGLLTAVTGVLVVAGVAFARPITAVIAPGLTERSFELAVTLVRILTPGIGFLVLSAWCLGVLNSHRRFFLSYVAPVLWNAAQIAALVVAGVVVLDVAGGPDPFTLATLGVALAWGTFAGGVAQFAVQLPTVLRLATGLRPSLRTDLPGVRETVRAFAPVVAGRGVVQLSAYVDVLLASFLAVGALAVLGFAQTLYFLPISLFGMSVAAAELPELSSVGAEERAGLGGRLDDGLARVAFFVLPTVTLYLVAGDLVVATLFQSGRFDPVATVQVWLVLCGYAVGLPASTSARLLQSALYAAGAPALPARISALRVVVSAAVGFLLMLQLDRVAVTAAGLVVAGDLPALAPLPEAVRGAQDAGARLGALGLSLAAGLTSWLEYALLRRAVRVRVAPTRLGGGLFGRTVAAAGLAGAGGLAARPLVADWHPLLAGPAAAALIGAVYLAAARRLGLPEAQSLSDVVGRLLRRG